MSNNSLKAVTDDQIKAVAYRSLMQMIKSVPSSLASIQINKFDVLKSRSDHYDYYGQGVLDIVTTADQKHYVIPIRLAFSVDNNQYCTNTGNHGTTPSDQFQQPIADSGTIISMSFTRQNHLPIYDVRKKLIQSLLNFREVDHYFSINS